MVSNIKYRSLIIILSSIWVFIVLLTNVAGQTINGRFQVVESSDSSYVGKIQIKLEEGSSVIGNAVIRYKFNPKRLSIPENPKEGTDFQIYNFQNGNYISSVSHPSEDVISINIAKLFGDDITITNEYIDIAEITFAVKDLLESNEFHSDMRQFFTPSSSEMWEIGSWVVSLGDSSIEPPKLISPLNDSTIVGTSVMFKWNSVSNRDFNQLQVATDSNFTNISNFIDTLHINEIEVNNLASGQHFYWRARASIDNAFGNYSTVGRFFTAFVDTTKPILLSPSDNEADVNTTISFAWEAIDSADIYQLEIAEDENFSNIFYINENVASNEQTVYNFEKNLRYYWRVRFSNSSGNSMYSKVFNFETLAGNPTIPDLLSPLPNSVDLESDLLFTWKNEGVADFFRIEIYTDSGIQNLYYEKDSIENTEIRVENFGQGKQYFWRVRSTNKNGNSGYSSIFKFRTRLGEPSILTLIEPLNNSVGLDNSLKFNWNPIDTALYYSIEIAEYSDFNNISISKDSIYSDEIIISDLEEGLQYYWRLKSYNQKGTNTVSNIFNFSTHVGIPELPVAISPANNSRIESEVTFSWTTVADAARYQLEVATDNKFKDLVFSKDTISVSKITVQNIGEGKNFYWRVKAKNDFGNSNFSNEKRFTVKVNKPSNLTAKVVDDEVIKLSWIDNSKMEEGFIIERSIKDDQKSNNFIAIDTLSSDKTEYVDYALENDETYVYRIYSENSVSVSDYSNTTELKFSIKGNSDPNIPDEFALSQNYPNPFNPSTKINYSLKEMSDVGILIYNIIGEEVTTLVNDSQDAGNYILEWDASNLASGIYIYVMKADSKVSEEHFQAVNKMVLLK